MERAATMGLTRQLWEGRDDVPHLQLQYMRARRCGSPLTMQPVAESGALLAITEALLFVVMYSRMLRGFLIRNHELCPQRQMNEVGWSTGDDTSSNCRLHWW